MPYAAQTRVPISRTKTDIEELLGKHGATSFAYATEGDLSLVAFSMSGRRVQITLMMLSIDDYARTAHKARQTAATQRSAWEQACRQRWRALLLIIRAELEAVESRTTTLESEFLADIVLPDGGTVGRWLAPQVEEAYATNTMLPVLRVGYPFELFDNAPGRGSYWNSLSQTYGYSWL